MDPILFSSLKQPSHGTQLIPYAYYHCILPTHLSDVLLHWHVEAEISIIREGKAIYQVGEETFHTQVGDLIFIAPNTLHSVHSIPGYTHVSDTLVFHLDYLGYSSLDQYALDYLHPLVNGSLRLFSRMTKNHLAYEDFFACMSRIFACLALKTDFYELRLKEQLHHFVYLLYKHQCIIETTISKTSSLHMDKVKDALQYIHSNYKEPITITELANICHFSKAHFMSFFKQTVGITCFDYIIQYRLQVATDLLKNSDLTVSEIAIESGFHNLSHFNRKFKAYYQVNPSHYRKNLHADY